MKTPDEIKAEYLAKRETYRNLVGTLYPSILYEELHKLREQYVAATRALDFWGDLPSVPLPRADGRLPR